MLPHSEIRTVYQSLYILVQPTPKARQWILMSLFSFSSLKCYWYLNSHWLEEQIWLSSCMYPGLLICISNVCVYVCVWSMLQKAYEKFCFPLQTPFQLFSSPDSFANFNHPELLSAFELTLPLPGMSSSIFIALLPPSQHFYFSLTLPSQRSVSRVAKTHLFSNHFLACYLILFSSMYTSLFEYIIITYLFTCWFSISTVIM